jgi:hypothetical protein
MIPSCDLFYPVLVDSQGNGAACRRKEVMPMA